MVMLRCSFPLLPAGFLHLPTSWLFLILDNWNKRIPTMPDQLYPEHELERAISSTKNADDSTAFGEKSPGVRRIEIIAACFTTWHRWVLFISVFLMACKLAIPVRMSS